MPTILGRPGKGFLGTLPWPAQGRQFHCLPVRSACLSDTCSIRWGCACGGVRGAYAAPRGGRGRSRRVRDPGRRHAAVGGAAPGDPDAAAEWALSVIDAVERTKAQLDALALGAWRTLHAAYRETTRGLLDVDSPGAPDAADRGERVAASATVSEVMAATGLGPSTAATTNSRPSACGPPRVTATTSCGRLWPAGPIGPSPTTTASSTRRPVSRTSNEGEDRFAVARPTSPPRPAAVGCHFPRNWPTGPGSSWVARSTARPAGRSIAW